MLIVGWSFLEGIGAALILPAIVALVASNFPAPQRPRAYGLVASAGAIAVAVGPLIGGLFTTYLSWRLGVRRARSGRARDPRARTSDGRATVPMHAPSLDLVGTVLSALGLALIVFGDPAAGRVGLRQPEGGGAAVARTVAHDLAGARRRPCALACSCLGEPADRQCGAEPLIDPDDPAERQLRGGLISFFFQYLLQAGSFFAVPLFLSVALGLSAIADGRAAAAALDHAAARRRGDSAGLPERVAASGRAARVRLRCSPGLVVMVAALDAGAGPEIVTWPMLLAGLGVGALASQLGAVTVSAVPDEQSGEVGGVQNTVTNLGASIGTALAGAVLIAALTASFMAGIQANPAIPASVKAQANEQLAAGVPFISDAQLETGLEKAGVPPATVTVVVDENASARLDALRASLSVLALIALIAIPFTLRLPTRPPE